jgi:hypothetical protein
MESVFQPGDLVRYQERVNGPWFEVQLLERRRVPGARAFGVEAVQIPWRAVVTDTGTYFDVEEAAEVLGQTINVSGRNLTLVRSSGSPRRLLAVGACAVGGFVLLYLLGVLEGGKTSVILGLCVLVGTFVLMIRRARR